MKYKRLIAGCIAAAMLTGCAAAPSEETVISAGSETAVQTEVSETSEQTETEASETEATEEQTEETEAPFILGDDGFLPEYETFELTSEDLTDGVWNSVIASENVSPELSWEPVEGADSYVIYMVDVTAYFFLHWKADAVTETDLPQGWATGASYVGPYPPSGVTHTYDVYVIALRGDVDRVRGTVNATNQNFASFIRGLDTDVDGNIGNIISYGYLSGEYTAP